MLTFPEADVLAWVTPILWPFLRVLALFSALPVIAQRSVPMRLRIGLAFLVAFCAQATIPTMAPIALDSAAGVTAVLQQVLVGVSLGFSVRIVFAAVEFAGEVIGLQMGLNFASFFNPMSGGEETAVSRFFGVISRVAQQMNIFAIGFPITLGVGLVGVVLTLPLMEMPFTMALERMLAHFQ